MPRKKEVDQDILEPEYRDAWDVKKLLIGFVVLAVIGITLFSFLKDASYFLVQSGSVLSARSQESIQPEDVPLPDSEDVSQILQKVKADLEKITSDNVYSSQSAIAEIIDNLQKLQVGDQSARDAICSVLCTSE